MKKLISTNPGNNYEILGEVEVSTPQEIAQAVAGAQRAKTAWKEIGLEARREYLLKAHQLFTEGKKDFAELISREMGKPITFANTTYQNYLNAFGEFLELGKEALADEITFEDGATRHRIVYEPIGVTAIIAPWNHPFGMFMWGVIPNLLAGNTVVFKHSEECPLSGKFIENIMSEANFPEGVFTEIYGDAEQGKQLIDENVDFIWFTGSSKAGMSIYEQAGKKFVKAVMELGGSNPGLLFADADIDAAVAKCTSKRLSNCGQACDSLKRLFVQKEIAEEVLSKLKNAFEEIGIGPTSDPNTEIGSLVAKRQLELLESQVQDAVSKGAKVVTGGKPASELRGAYYLPTILTGVTEDMRIWKEEVFGPVLAVYEFETEEQAIAQANDSEYGLGSLVFTSDKQRGARVASKLQTGTVEINNAIHWLTCNPFGGYKKSGMGREHGIHGFRELCEIKVISEDK